MLAVLSNKWLLAFSCEKNFKSIFSVKRSIGEIPSLDGIRCLNLSLLVIGHKGLILNYTPMDNRVEMNIFFKSLISVPLRAGYLHTDVFLMLSGLLVSYTILGKLQRGHSINVLKETVGRYCRSMPPAAALILFTSFILPQLKSGPQWNTLIGYQSELCKSYWWRNFLMIQNWFGVEKMCIMNTHHITTDFELFIIAVLLVIFLHKAIKYAVIILSCLAASSAIANFSVTYVKRINYYFYFGTE